jgi:hypothetical protein
MSHTGPADHNGVSLAPKNEHVALLQTLVQCPPGKGLVVGDPGPATLHTFQDCVDSGWAEMVHFGSCSVWKATRSGRATYHLAVAEKFALETPAPEC